MISIPTPFPEIIFDSGVLLPPIVISSPPRVLIPYPFAIAVSEVKLRPIILPSTVKLEPSLNKTPAPVLPEITFGSSPETPIEISEEVSAVYIPFAFAIAVSPSLLITIQLSKISKALVAPPN